MTKHGPCMGMHPHMHGRPKHTDRQDTPGSYGRRTPRQTDTTLQVHLAGVGLSYWLSVVFQWPVVAPGLWPPPAHIQLPSDGSPRSQSPASPRPTAWSIPE